jgi:CRP-like cAMP-binding protein
MTDAAIVQGLAQSKLATELTPEQCQVLSRSMTSRDLRTSEVLVREGDSDDHLYVIVSGSLGVVKAAGTSNEVTLNVMRPGDVVGELSFLDGATRFASLVAMADTRVLGLSRATSKRCSTATRTSSTASCGRSSASCTTSSVVSRCRPSSSRTTCTRRTAATERRRGELSARTAGAKLRSSRHCSTHRPPREGCRRISSRGRRETWMSSARRPG